MMSENFQGKRADEPCNKTCAAVIHPSIHPSSSTWSSQEVCLCLLRSASSNPIQLWALGKDGRIINTGETKNWTVLGTYQRRVLLHSKLLKVLLKLS